MFVWNYYCICIYSQIFVIICFFFFNLVRILIFCSALQFCIFYVVTLIVIFCLSYFYCHHSLTHFLKIMTYMFSIIIYSLQFVYCICLLSVKWLSLSFFFLMIYLVCAVLCLHQSSVFWLNYISRHVSALLIHRQ